MIQKGRLTHLIMDHPPPRDIIQNLCRLMSPWRPILLKTVAKKNAILGLGRGDGETYLEIVKEGGSKIKSCWLCGPVVHLDVDVGICVRVSTRGGGQEKDVR